jgi:FlaA1/EpsC-like NDP-sugar epimerase
VRNGRCQATSKNNDRVPQLAQTDQLREDPTPVPGGLQWYFFGGQHERAVETWPDGGEWPAMVRLTSVAARLRVDLVYVAVDAVFIAIAFGACLLLRFDGAVPDHYLFQFVITLPLIVGVGLAMNWLWGLYGELWEHASVLEARRIILSTVSTGAVLTAVVIIGPRLLPLSVVGLGCILYTALSGAFRFRSRLLSLQREQSDQPGLRVVILGAGESGATLVREMLRSPRAGLIPVAILDDDPRTHGRNCQGVPVLGAIASLPRVAADVPLHQAVLAVADPPTELVRRAADLAEEADISLRVLRGVAELVRGHVTLQDVRDLRIEDLLGREQVVTDLDAVRSLLTGRRVLVTGAGGSIGSEITRQVAAAEPAALLVLDHDETHLHELCAGLTGPAGDDHVVQLLADIRDRDVMLRLFARHQPEIVFHAAAHKHVPVLEQYPAEAIRTNVLGTMNVVDAAIAVGVQRLVFISTDKAVNPSCIMGASKKLGEQIVLAGSSGGTQLCAVRFGNVLGSRGSVIPTFMRQINSGGPVTVTDPRMTRFFMSIREAVQLVLQAAAMSTGQDMFVLEMGEQVRIIDLAQRMIRLAGRRVGEDVEIHVTGIRPGEKLVEELHDVGDELQATVHPAIRRLRPAVMSSAALGPGLAWLTEALAVNDDAQLREALFQLAGAVSTEADRLADDRHVRVRVAPHAGSH